MWYFSHGKFICFDGFIDTNSVLPVYSRLKTGLMLDVQKCSICVPLVGPIGRMEFSYMHASLMRFPTLQKQLGAGVKNIH